MMATERMQRYGNQVVVGDLVLLDDGSTKPIIVTETDLIGPSIRDGIKIENVVLPMPGYDTVYPTNEIGSLYQDFLQKEQVKFDKHMVNDESKARGSYRRLIVHVENLTYERFPYTASHSDNIVDVKFTFTLPKGSYATMLLRELMLKTVARDSIEYCS
jgi:tRNA pseudouridine13 synthase